MGVLYIQRNESSPSGWAAMCVLLGSQPYIFPFLASKSILGLGEIMKTGDRNEVQDALHKLLDLKQVTPSDAYGFLFVRNNTLVYSGDVYHPGATLDKDLAAAGNFIVTHYPVVEGGGDDGGEEGKMAAKSVDMTRDLSFLQQWDNESTAVLSLVTCTCNTPGRIVWEPTKELPEKTMESLAWFQNADTLPRSSTDGIVVWETPQGVRFGIDVHIPQQDGSQLPEPYYLVWSGTGEPDFSNSTKYGMEIYQFDGIGPYFVTVTPSAPGPSISRWYNILIEDKFEVQT